MQIGLDSSFIAQGVRPPQLDDPVQNLEGIARVQALAQQAKLAPLRQQQLQNDVTQQQQQIQEGQRAIQARTAMSTALQNNSSQGDDGKWTVDPDGFTKDMTAAGYGPEAIKANKDRFDEAQSAQKFLNDQLDTRAKQATQFSNIAGTIQYPNFDETDPVVKQTQIANYQATGKNAIAAALQGGLIDQSHAAWANAALANPTPETAAQLKQYGMMGVAHADQVKAVRDQLNDAVGNNLKIKQGNEAQARADQVNAQIPGTRANAQQASRANAATKLSAAQTPADYTRAYDDLDDDVASAFPKPETITDASSLKAALAKVQALGMTPSQKVVADTAAAKLPGQKAASTSEELGLAAQTAPGNQADWDDWRSGFSPDAQSRIPAKYTKSNRLIVQALGKNRRYSPTQMVDADGHPLVFDSQGGRYVPQQSVTGIARAASENSGKADQKTVQGIANRIINDAGGSLQDAYTAAQKSYQNDDDVNANRAAVIKYLGGLVRQGNLNAPKPSWRDRLSGSSSAPTPQSSGSSPAPRPAQPQSTWREGDVVQNAAGEKLVLRGGKWVRP